MIDEASTFLDLAAMGISHQTAPLSLREAFAIICHRLFKNRPNESKPSDARFHETRLAPSVLIATCNRCELYLPAQNHLIAHVLQRLEASSLPLGWKEHLYIYKHDRAFRHLCQVTSGLKSAFFGETQIQGQVKVAYTHASEQPLTHHLHFAFQRALQIAKRVRQEAIHGSRLSLEKLVWELSEKDSATFFIGASATNQLLIDYFTQKGARDLFLVNRSDSPRARALAQHRHLTILPWSEIDRWANYPNVVVATTSPHYLETFDKRQKTLFTLNLFDLSVPCNVNPAIQNLELGMTLRNIDDLKQHLQTHQSAQIIQYKQAISLIDELTQRHALSLQASQGHRYRLAAPMDSCELATI